MICFSELRSLLVRKKVPKQRSLTNAVKRLVSPPKPNLVSKHVFNNTFILCLVIFNTCDVYLFVLNLSLALVHARARPTPHLIQLPVSFEATQAPASTLTHPPPASPLTHPAVSSEVDDSTLLTEAVQVEETNPAGMFTFQYLKHSTEYY